MGAAVKYPAAVFFIILFASFLSACGSLNFADITEYRNADEGDREEFIQNVLKNAGITEFDQHLIDYIDYVLLKKTWRTEVLMKLSKEEPFKDFFTFALPALYYAYSLDNYRLKAPKAFQLPVADYLINGVEYYGVFKNFPMPAFTDAAIRFLNADEEPEIFFPAFERDNPFNEKNADSLFTKVTAFTLCLYVIVREYTVEEFCGLTLDQQSWVMDAYMTERVKLRNEEISIYEASQVGTTAHVMWLNYGELALKSEDMKYFDLHDYFYAYALNLLHICNELSKTIPLDPTIQFGNTDNLPTI